jgi:hypothetical protein
MLFSNNRDVLNSALYLYLFRHAKAAIWVHHALNPNCLPAGAQDDMCVCAQHTKKSRVKLRIALQLYAIIICIYLFMHVVHGIWANSYRNNVPSPASPHRGTQASG